MIDPRYRFRSLVLLPAVLLIGCTAPPGAPREPAGSAGRAASEGITSVAPGCSMPDLPEDTAPNHAEVVGRRGSPIYPPILAVGTKVNSLDDGKMAAVMAPVSLPRTPDGLPVQTIIFDPNQDADETDGKLNPQVTIVYSKAEIKPSDTIVDILGGGGAIFQQIVSYGRDAAVVHETIGEHATIIKLGEFDAALVESSTWPGDFRSHALYWSDGQLDFTLKIAGSSEEVVKVGQSLYCE